MKVLERGSTSSSPIASVITTSDATLMVVSCEIGMENAPELSTGVRHAIDSPQGGVIVVDLRDVEYMSAWGVQACSRPTSTPRPAQ